MATKPTKTNKGRRYSAPKHTECSKKRSVLKDRIRALEAELAEVTEAQHQSNLQVNILRDVIATIAETMGLETVLDPFGFGLSQKDLSKEKHI